MLVRLPSKEIMAINLISTENVFIRQQLTKAKQHYYGGNVLTLMEISVLIKAIDKAGSEDST